MSLDSARIAVAIADIAASGDFTRRIPHAAGDRDSAVAIAVNALLDGVGARDKILKERLDDLTDARDDARTATLMLRRLKEDLSARTTQLNGALQKAAAANSAKSQFLANMSHEIRSPMNGILGMAELLRRGVLDDKQRQQVNTIVHSGRALLQIINDILDFSKIESGKFDLDPKPFDLTMCLSDVVELLRATAHGKNLALHLQIDPTLPRRYVGDAGRIRQIVMNLTGNAVKFTDHGSVTLKLSGMPDGDRMALLIDVVDTGIGIPADKLDDVFEKFSQVDGTGSRRHEGTGLGLSISQLLAHRMDGGVSATSEFGNGSTFSFRLKLPVKRDAPEVMAARVELEGQRVALFGDNSDLDAASEGLSEAGCRISTAPLLGDSVFGNADGPDRPRLDAAVLFDVSMTDEVLRQIALLREAPCRKDVPIVVCVTSGAPGDARRITAAGAHGYLCGAFDAGQLEQALRQVLQPTVLQGAAADTDRIGPPELVTRHSLAEHPAPAPRPAAAAGGRFKVLVVDDGMVNQEVAKEFLEEFQCDVSIANNGAEAVAATGAMRFDLIMMDCQMPVMDGFVATTVIRQRTTGATPSSVPIVALTANAFASDREKCFASGMSDFVSKPFLPADFEAVVNKWLTASSDAAA